MAQRSVAFGILVAAFLAALPAAPALARATKFASSSSASASTEHRHAAELRRLDRALTELHAKRDGPPGIAVVVQRGRRLTLRSAGVADVRSDAPLGGEDHMRLASVSKAFSGAAALSLVARHRLSLDDTLGKWLPTAPPSWSAITLAELLHHTSGIPDFGPTPAFQEALRRSLLSAPPPAQLYSYVAGEGPTFTPGTQYHYSNTDNVLVGLMIEAATGHSYESELQTLVFAPLGLTRTTLPRGAAMPTPLIHGYQVAPPEPAEDVSELFAAGWSWAAGGIVSTPLETNTFVRAYVRGALTDSATHAAQFSFVPGNSEPPGPGTNSAGLALFRYRTPCGTVFGHTGNTPGYTQFMAATADGSRSVVVSVNAQITPRESPARFDELRRIYGLAVCAALT